MQKTLFLLLLSVMSSLAWGQTNYEKFKALYKNHDTTKIKSLLREWEKSNPDDPELYTAAINYYFSYSKKEIIALDQEEKKQDGFQLTDSAGNVAGYIHAAMGFDTEKLNKAMSYANAGIAKFPDRLDIRFGKSFMLQQMEDFGNFTKEITRALDYSQVNKNNWLWTENKKLEDGEGFFLETIQSYLKQLYDTEDDNLLPYMIEIGEATLKYYPHHIEILSTTSVALLLTKNYDRAIAYLKQAEKLNPKDFIVLNNIAQGYKLKGDKANAIKYYELTEKYGDEQAKEQARENIRELKK